jgi:hypothetical protein
MLQAKEKAINLFKANPQKALAFCKKWRNLGPNKGEIIRGAECFTNPSFYASLGFDVEACKVKAIEHLRSHLGL